MEPYLSRIGDVTIERVLPRNKETVKDASLPPSNEIEGEEEQEEKEDVIKDETIENKSLDVLMADGDIENNMDTEHAASPTPVIFPDSLQAVDDDDEEKPEEEEKIDGEEQKEGSIDQEKDEINDEEALFGLSKEEENKEELNKPGSPMSKDGMFYF